MARNHSVLCVNYRSFNEWQRRRASTDLTPLVRLLAILTRMSPNKYPLFKTIKIKFCEWFSKDYRRYERYPMGKKLAEWLEKLVTVDIAGTTRPIRYYELEKELLLSKEDIARLLIYICELSGFM